jgi:glycosyltransferase involved in cell wall biosynthesis
MKPDIIIKSFNRAFYLQRCLESIERHVSNYGNIYVLDDGSPKRYLDRIKQLFPKVKLLRSENADEKAGKIENREKVSGYDIPSALWIDTVNNSSNYFLMTEDDVWLTADVDLLEVSVEMQSNNVHLAKLGWQGNTKYAYNFKESQLGKNLIAQYASRLFLANERIMKMVLENRYYLFSILCRLGVTNNKTILEYYNLLSIPMGFYRKDFWLFTWKDSKGRAKEYDLIKNAVVWVYNNRQNKNVISRLNEEVLKTTYISSAIGDYRKHSANFDMLAFNYILNEQWYQGHLDPMENFPKDFNPEYLASFLEGNHNPLLSKEGYDAWCKEFKNQFRAAGAVVD